MSSGNFTAASFVTEVLTTAEKFEKEDINTKLGKLSKKIEEVKVEVYDALQKKYEEFYPNLTTAMDLNTSVEALAKEMCEVGDKIENEIKSQLQVSTTEFQDLSSQLTESNSILVILKKLSQIHEHLQCIDKSLKSQEFVEATKSLNEIQDLLAKPINESDSEIKILKKLQVNYHVQKDRMVNDVEVAWSNNIKWMLPKASSGDSKETVTWLEIQQSNKSKEILKNASQAMAEIDLLHDKLSMFSSRLLSHFIKPLVMKKELHYTDESKGECKRISVKFAKMNESGEPLSPVEVFKRLVFLFHFLDQIFSYEVSIPDNGSNKKVPAVVMSQLGAIISSDVLDVIISECLKHSIPTSHKDLENYHEIISQTETFQQELVKLKFIKEDNATLTDFVNNVNVLFANKKCQEILERAREMMTSHIHDTIEVTENHPFGDLPGLDLGVSGTKKAKTAENLALSSDAQLCAKVLKLPTCHVSTSVQSLVELAYETLQEATHSKQQCAIQMFYCVRNMFELYCSVVPTYHKQGLETIPQQAALHHNNCMYIAHHLLTLGHQYRNKLPEPLNQGAATFVDLVPTLRRLGTDCFLKQMSKQKDQLLDLLKQTNGMVGLAEGENGLTAERAIKQVLYHLQQVSHVWQPVLPSNIYCKSIGTLLNSVIVEVLTNVTSLDDISADDATQLHTVMSIIPTRVPELFKQVSKDNDPVEALLQHHVRKWLKYKEMLVLLNAGLQEICDRWAEGKGPLAHEFSPNEVKQLIRALFQNTDRRAGVLTKIK